MLQVALLQNGVVAEQGVDHGGGGAIGRRLRRLCQRQPPQQVQHPVRKQPLSQQCSTLPMIGQRALKDTDDLRLRQRRPLQQVQHSMRRQPLVAVGGSHGREFEAKQQHTCWH